MCTTQRCATLFHVSDPFALDQQVCFALYRASRATTAVYRPLLDRLGVTYPQYLVLLALWERDARGVQDLCDALDLDTGTLSPLLKRLESAGLVERTRQRDDERRVVVRLTDAGNALDAFELDLQSAVGAPEVWLPFQIDPNSTIHGMYELAPAGTERGQFNLPRGIAVGPDGSFYVVDTANMRIQKFDATGKLVEFATTGETYFASVDSIFLFSAAMRKLVSKWITRS